MILAVVGLVFLLTGSKDEWVWWIGLGLMSPLGALFLFHDVGDEAVSGDWGDSAVGGDCGGGGGGDGGG